MADETTNQGIRGNRHRLLGPREPRLGALPLHTRHPAPNLNPHQGAPKQPPAASRQQAPQSPSGAITAPGAWSGARLGAAQPAPHAAARPKTKRVLFVCIGNSCRSQMAEAFAKKYGADVVIVRSAGVSPALAISPLTRQVLAERNLNIDEHFPKGLDVAALEKFDVAVNMSGVPLQFPGAQVIEWAVPDPIGQPIGVYQTVANQIEALVMRLILDIRTELKAAVMDRP